MNAELVWHCVSISVLTQEVDTTAHVARDLSSKAAMCRGKFAHNGYVNKVYAITINRNTAISYHLYPCVLASPVINMWAYRLPFPRVFARLRHAEEDVD